MLLFFIGCAVSMVSIPVNSVLYILIKIVVFLVTLFVYYIMFDINSFIKEIGLIKRKV